ncbi:MAG: penicillin-binding protein 2 [Woeseia sp.]|nr:penicillin-binding protein 2 [Woeseia sp.]|tara:strand:- start:2862 stop:4766 length:1905 start_codon:yes stop_codon:yes gene_type:complete
MIWKKFLSPIKDHNKERNLFIGRVILVSVVLFFLLGLVVARLVQLQVFNHELFAEKSQGNRIRIQAVPPIRGLIFDRNGEVIAENLPAYQLELIPEQVVNIRDTLERLSIVGLINFKDIPSLEKQINNQQRFKPVTLKFRMTEEEIAKFATQRPRFPGVNFQSRLVRHYPHGELFAHSVGYVGALSIKDLERLDSSQYAASSHTGKTGVEISFENKLHGKVGFEHLITNARGRQVPADKTQLLKSLPQNEMPYPGLNIYLSLDVRLQRKAYKELKDKRGSIVALNPKTGEILALVSAPSFDPNLFAAGMSKSQYNELENNSNRPLFNRAVRGTYPPGSTIKPMLSLAALQTGATNLTSKTLCTGYFQLEGNERRYLDWKPDGHGLIGLHDAIAQSCNVYFYEISDELGIDNMHKYLTQFGLGRKTGIDIFGERNGLMPSKEWKQNTFQSQEDKHWYQGETVIAAIGQGFMLATPLQLASAVGTLATKGKRFQPYIVKATEDPIRNVKEFIEPVLINNVEIDNEYYWDEVLEAMHNVLQGPRGTARAVGFDSHYKMAGKSGTAQIVSVDQNENHGENEIQENQRDHALFISFAPFDDPQIAVAVIIENGVSGSSVAAPIAKAIMDEFLKIKNASD